MKLFKKFEIKFRGKRYKVWVNFDQRVEFRYLPNISPRTEKMHFAVTTVADDLLNTNHERLHVYVGRYAGTLGFSKENT